MPDIKYRIKNEEKYTEVKNVEDIVIPDKKQEGVEYLFTVTEDKAAEITTSLEDTDVTKFQRAKVVDGNLKSENILSGKTILGVEGSALIPSGEITITKNTITDVTEYKNVITNIPASEVTSGKKDIVDTSEVDVTEYKTAQITDANLKKENIADGVVVLGITGTHRGGEQSGDKIITQKGTTDVYNYATATVNDSNLIEENIIVGKTILGVGGNADYVKQLDVKPSVKETNIIKVGDKFYVWKSNPDYLCFTANTAGSTVGMAVNGAPTRSVSFEYSTDKNTWNTFTVGSTTITLSNIGDKVYFRGNNPNGISESYYVYYKFVMTGSIAASGSIMSLIDITCESLTIPCDYCFCYMFRGCTSSLTSSPKLPAIILAKNCYSYMFFGCKLLKTTPELPATTLAEDCYHTMFRDCISLTTAPTLPAVDLANNCYTSMFYGCTSLTTAPSLPATTLKRMCYWSMFWGCTSLTTVPSLPATTLAEYCYSYMFLNCTSLYVSDTSVSGTCDKAWRIPTSGTFTNTFSQSSMFANCLGTRSSNNMAGAQGQSYTYYTQNEPV